MTPDERNLLTDFANKVAQMPAPARDPEAEDLIRTKIGSRPDALYLMTQTVMIQNMALERAQQQIQDLQSRVQQPGQIGSGPSSWLGGQQTAPPPQQVQYAQPAAAPPPQYASPMGGGGFAGGGFLRGAAQTAAGVAAGTLAAGAIESMFSSHGGGMFGGNEFVGSGGGMAPTEEIVNNYYDSPGDRDRGADFRDAGSADRNNFADSSNLDDSSSLDDNSQFDDSNMDLGDDGGFDSGSDDTFA